MDAYGKMRADYGPRAASTVNRTVRSSWSASEPYRSEAAARGAAALEGLRGHIRPDEIAMIAKGRERARRLRIVMWVGAAGATVAAAASGAMAWRRSRDTAWAAEAGDGEPASDDKSETGADGADGLADKVKGAAHRVTDRVTDRVRVMSHHGADGMDPASHNGTGDPQNLDM